MSAATAKGAKEAPPKTAAAKRTAKAAKPEVVTATIRTVPITSMVRVNLEAMDIPAKYSDVSLSTTQAEVMLSVGDSDAGITVELGGPDISSQEVLAKAIEEVAAIIDSANARRLEGVIAEVKLQIRKAWEVTSIDDI